MQKFYIIWTYVANYGKLEVKAKDKYMAAEQVYAFYGPHFREEATVYVFDHDPALVIVNGAPAG